VDSLDIGDRILRSGLLPKRLRGVEREQLVTDPKKRALKFRFNTTDIPACSVTRVE